MRNQYNWKFQVTRGKAVIKGIGWILTGSWFGDDIFLMNRFVSIKI